MFKVAMLPPLFLHFGGMATRSQYVVSRTLERPIWRNTTIIRDNVIEPGVWRTDAAVL
jgi:hypothetical protein